MAAKLIEVHFQAANFMLKQIMTSFDITTNLYDKIQNMQGGIFYKPSLYKPDEAA